MTRIKRNKKNRQNKSLFCSNSGKEAYAYENPAFEDALSPGPNPNDDTGEGTTDSHAYGPNQETSQIYKSCTRARQSPFSFKFHLKIPSESKQKYRELQHEVLDIIKLYISTIKYAIESITTEPARLSHWLKELMEKTYIFHQSISNMGSEYFSLLEDLGISDGGHIKDLDRHIQEVEIYKRRFSDYFSRIKEMVEDPIKTSKQRGTSKPSSSTLGSKERPDIEENPSDDEASGSAQLKSEASGGAPSTNVEVVNLMTFD
ncbi:hypothetical protein BASA62_001462 [Batrachochytrium salamandrivorans]|nr:hypothetical protein BASA62_001462 [Batrachochytrium salamandrivorans]